MTTTLPRPIEPGDIKPGQRVRARAIHLGDLDLYELTVTSVSEDAISGRWVYLSPEHYTWTLLEDVPEPEPPVPDYAHVIAPGVDGRRFIAESDPSDVAAQMVAYHAARAYGFIKGWQESDMRWSEGLSQGLLSFELAVLYYRWACSDLDTADREAAGLAGTLASPQVIEPEIVDLLDWCEIDPESIKPYAGDPR